MYFSCNLPPPPPPYFSQIIGLKFFSKKHCHVCLPSLVLYRWRGKTTCRWLADSQYSSPLGENTRTHTHSLSLSIYPFLPANRLKRKSKKKKFYFPSVSTLYTSYVALIHVKIVLNISPSHPPPLYIYTHSPGYTRARIGHTFNA